MNVFVALLLLLNVYLPAVLNQGTAVKAYVSNPCGPINNAYMEFHFEPGGEVVRLGTDENGRLRFMGPRANVVEAQLYGQVYVADVTSSDGKADFQNLLRLVLEGAA